MVQRGCQKELGQVSIFLFRSRFTGKLAFFRSGAEGIRTLGLRRAKAALSVYESGTVNALTCRRVALLTQIVRFSGPAKGRDDASRH